MGEQLIWPRVASQIGLLRERLNQRTDVAHDGQLAGGEERMDIHQARMKTEGHSNTSGRDRKKSRLRDGKAVPSRSVGGVPGRIERNNHVVAIIPTGMKNATVRFV